MTIPLRAIDLAVALLSQPTGGAPTEPADFRAHVWMAYALVLVLLALFTVWTVMKVKRLTERLDLLRDRFEKAHPEEKQSTERAPA